MEPVPEIEDEDLSPCPFTASPCGTSASPGTSLAVLFSTACPSSGSLLCCLTLWKTVFQVALVSMIQSSGFPILQCLAPWKLYLWSCYYYRGSGPWVV